MELVKFVELFRGKEEEGNWNARERGLQRFRGLIRGGIMSGSVHVSVSSSTSEDIRKKFLDWMGKGVSEGLVNTVSRFFNFGYCQLSTCLIPLPPLLLIPFIIPYYIDALPSYGSCHHLFINDWRLVHPSC